MLPTSQATADGVQVLTELVQTQSVVHLHCSCCLCKDAQTMSVLQMSVTRDSSSLQTSVF